MARANNGGWDFIQAGEIYQYKEDYFIGEVKILEDNSTKDEYKFKIQFLNGNLPKRNGFPRQVPVPEYLNKK